MYTSCAGSINAANHVGSGSTLTFGGGALEVTAGGCELGRTVALNPGGSTF